MVCVCLCLSMFVPTSALSAAHLHQNGLQQDVVWALAALLALHAHHQRDGVVLGRAGRAQARAAALQAGDANGARIDQSAQGTGRLHAQAGHRAARAARARGALVQGALVRRMGPSEEGGRGSKSETEWGVGARSPSLPTKPQPCPSAAHAHRSRASNLPSSASRADTSAAVAMVCVWGEQKKSA